VTTFTFDDLVAWSKKLPLWQRDALRRVLSASLTPSDIADLCAMAKSAQGLPIPGAPVPTPATTAHVRSSGASAPPVALTCVRDITNVNALAPGPINFAPDGLTVIYGDNASGKSGIARILKRAGRAREPGGSIRPSVFEPDPGKPASATIDFRVGSSDRAFSWVDGAATDDELTRINVFDAGCASVQVEEDNRLAYTPDILQAFQDLAEACRATAAALKTEKEELDSQRSPQIGLLSLRPQTTASILIGSLSFHTKPKDIDALCAVSDKERERHRILMRALSDNPASQADLLESRARRLKELEDLAAVLERDLSDAALDAFEQQISDAEVAGEAARAARESFAANSALAGIGTDVWKQLWESARRYSETLAYPSESFPVTREDAFCVLC
jgi:hypothetical protein